MQRGSLYVGGTGADSTCFLKYRTTDDSGNRVHKTVFLCKRDGRYDWWFKRGKWGFSSAVRDLQRATMDRINAEAQQALLAATPQAKDPGDLRIADFWETVFLPYCQEIRPVTAQLRMKPSTVRGFRQIWRQHLGGTHQYGGHFADMALKEYEPAMGTDFLQGLVDTQRKTTIKHIKALATAIFKCAVVKKYLKVNPWHDVVIPVDAVESDPTEHYTLEEAENIISALSDHVDAQSVMALSCFLGLRPGETAAVRWEDFEREYVYIRRSVVRGVVGTPKTLESLAPLPLLAQVKIPLGLWWKQCGRPSEGWVFPSANNTPVDLHNLVARVIRPHVEGAAYQVKGKAQKCIRCGVVPKGMGKWKAIYAGRRGAGTAIVEATNGNLAVAQALLRHKNQMTTATFYKKAISAKALVAGVKLLEAVANGKGGDHE